MNIILDNAIFGLQQSGGISVVWREHLQRISLNKEVNLQYINYPNDNKFSKGLNLPVGSVIKKHIPLIISRYLNVTLDSKKSIFHSSYYRVSSTKNVINVTTVHDFSHEYFRKGLARKVHTLQKEYAIKNSQGIICISENTKKDLLYFNPKIDESSIKVIHNGVSDDFYVLQELDAIKLLSLVDFESKSYILYVGDRKATYKNFKTAVSSAKIIGMPLVLVGGGVLRSDEKHLLNNELGNSNFSHLSYISNSDLNLLYNNAFCLLYPSSYEGFGIPVIEAQKAGCPVISSKFSSIPEITNDSALLIENISENEIVYYMRNLLNDSSLNSNIIEKGISNSNRFSWDKTHEETVKFYKRIYENG